MREVGIGFMFAPAFHPSMKYASAPRREIGIRTVFNVLGPLTNPAGAQAQVVGIPDEEFGYKMARALGILGTKHAILVHGLEGIDEISIAGRSRIWEVRSRHHRRLLLVSRRFRIQGGSEGHHPGRVTGRECGHTEVGARWRERATARRHGDERRGGNHGSERDREQFRYWRCQRHCGLYTRRLEDSIDSGRAMEKLEALIRITSTFGAGQ